MYFQFHINGPPSRNVIKTFKRFNPRTRVGCDNAAVFLDIPNLWFQSTHPCGVRRHLVQLATTAYSFNPRTRVGCDKQGFVGLAPGMFQSTHPCGVRPGKSPCMFAGFCFNPRTRVGCDGTLDLAAAGQLVSIHAPVWGATHGFRASAKTILVSIHAPVWGATRD